MTDNAFLAVPLSDEDRHLLSAALADASPGAIVPGRRVPPANWHITVRFLGEVEDLVLDRLLAELDQSLDVVSGYALIRGLDGFPNKRACGIAYGAVDDRDGALTELAAQCEEAAREVGLAPEERPFVPHVTLSRLRPRASIDHVIRRFGDFSVRIPVDAVVLYRSARRSDGMRYREIERISLA